MDWKSSDHRSAHGQQANTNAASMQWLPLEWQPAPMRMGEQRSTPTQSESSPPQRSDLTSPWLPVPGAPATAVGRHNESVCEFELARGRNRRLGLIRENRGLVGTGAALTAIAAPVAFVVSRPASVAHVPGLAVAHAQPHSAPVIVAGTGRYGVTHRRAAHSRPTLRLAIQAGRHTSSVPVTSSPIRSAGAAAPLPGVTHAATPPQRSVPVSPPAPVHRTAPIHTPTARPTRSAPAVGTSTSGTSSSSSSGQSPSPDPNPNPNPSPVQTAVNPATQTAGQAVQTAQSTVSKIHVP